MGEIPQLAIEQRAVGRRFSVNRPVELRANVVVFWEILEDAVARFGFQTEKLVPQYHCESVRVDDWR